MCMSTSAPIKTAPSTRNDEAPLQGSYWGQQVWISVSNESSQRLYG